MSTTLLGDEPPGACLVQLSTATDVDTMVRIEDKFIVPRRYEPDVFDVLQRRLARADFGDDTRFTLVESIYLDSPDLDLLREHMQSAPERYKLRVRWYAPNGVRTRQAGFIEVKRKAAGICTKRRLAIDPESAACLGVGAEVSVTPALVAVNQQLRPKQLRSRVSRLNDMVRTRRASARILIGYRRRAFEGEGVRVTVDMDVRCELQRTIDREIAGAIRGDPFYPSSVTVASAFDPAHSLIVEVKHSAGRPDWLERFMSEIGCGATKFSKYCYAMLGAIGCVE